MKETDLISIIVPIFNGAGFLKSCVKSILNNSYKNIEVLLIDDGSTDDSYKICQDLYTLDKRIRIFKKQNGGIADARNFGLEKAVGKYICFADQDDIVPYNAYENMYNNIQKYNSDICIGSFQRLYKKNKTKMSYLNHTDYCLEDKKSIQEYIMSMTSQCRQINYNSDCNKYSWTIWNCMYKKSVIIKNDIKVMKIVNYEDDFLFNFHYLLYCNSISFSKNVVYLWRKNRKSESQSFKYIMNLYEKRKKLNYYIIDKLKNFDNFDEITWLNLSYERNFADAIINEANPKNIRTKKESINYLINLYNEDIKDRKLNFHHKFNLKNFFKNSSFLTYRYARKHKITTSYNVNKYFYYKLIYKIMDLIYYIIY